MVYIPNAIEGTDITSSVNISVVEEPTEDVYELIVDPNVTYVLQNKSQQFSVNLYKNGIKQADEVTFTDLSTGIPSGKYVITGGDNNTFTLTNQGMYMGSPVIVR